MSLDETTRLLMMRELLHTTPADALEAKDEPETPSQILRQRDLERARRVEAEQKLAVTMEALDHMIDASDGERDPEGYFYTVAANATNEVRSGAQGCVKYPLPKRKET